MKQVAESCLRNIKASIAVGAADLCPKAERLDVVKALLRCDENEARALISHGRRLARQKGGKAA